MLVSVRLWNSKMVGPKKQDFCPRINIFKGFLFKKTSFDDLGFLQSQFSVSKINGVFSKKKIV